MFDIGFSELLVIAVVALLVLGPERLPRAARFAGLWVRRARAQWYAVKSELETELADEEMRRSIHRAQEELRQAQAELERDGERRRAQLRDVEAQMTRPSGSLADDVGAHAGREALPARDVHDEDADVAASFNAPQHPAPGNPDAGTAAPQLDERPRDVG
jgi:sec-independent protein translocase protein TatB